MEIKKLPPKAVTALVFGILSIGPFAFIPLLAFIVQDILTSRGETSVYAVVPFIPSIIFSVISLSNARRGEDAIKQKPELYRGTRMLKAARVTAYIGAFLSFAALILIWLTVKK